MALSSDILTQFAKLVKTEEKDNGKTLNGTYKKIDGKEKRPGRKGRGDV